MFKGNCAINRHASLSNCIASTNWACVAAMLRALLSETHVIACRIVYGDIQRLNGAVSAL